MLDAERTLVEVQDRLAVGRTDANTSLIGVYRALEGTGRRPTNLRAEALCGHRWSRGVAREGGAPGTRS